MADEIKVITQSGKDSGTVTLNPEIFNTRINRRLLDLVVLAYTGNKRRGLADTKTRREIRGGGKKPWRQKGTGNARQGSIRSPQWRGGGTVFGPQPRSYRTELSKTMKNKAIVSALSLKKTEKKISVIENIKIDEGKTKKLCKIIDDIKMNDLKVLYVVNQHDENLKRASKNIERVFKIQNVKDINAYDILRRNLFLIQKDALPELEKRVIQKDTDKKREHKSDENSL